MIGKSRAGHIASANDVPSLVVVVSNIDDGNVLARDGALSRVRGGTAAGLLFEQCRGEAVGRDVAVWRHEGHGSGGQEGRDIGAFFLVEST